MSSHPSGQQKKGLVKCNSGTDCRREFEGRYGQDPGRSRVKQLIERIKKKMAGFKKNR